MANILLLNQNQVWNGLGTLTYTIPTTGAYNVKVQSTFPSAWPDGSGAGSGQGLGSGTGGGGEGFVSGDQGLGEGGVGQGFGPSNNYQQPSAQGSNQTSGNNVTSGVSIVVNQNGSPIYTSTTPALIQSAVQFKTGFLATAADTITVVISSPVTFTVSSANATAGAVYTNNGQSFTVQSTIAGGTTLVTNGSGLPLLSGTLTKTSGTGDATITFSAYSALSLLDDALSGVNTNLSIGQGLN
jgi:hypothetical protein